MQLSESFFQRFIENSAFLGNRVIRIKAQLFKDFRVFTEFTHGGALGDVNSENEVPLALVENLSTLPVDFVETELPQTPVRVGALVLELHGPVFPLGEVLKGTLGIGLILQSPLFSAPVDGPELDHLGKEGNDFLKDHDGLDGSLAVLGPLAGKFREGFQVDVLRVLVAQSLSEEKVESEGSQDGIEPVPFMVRKSSSFLLLQAIEVEILLIALVLQIVTDLRIGLRGAIGCHVVAGVIVGTVQGLG